MLSLEDEVVTTQLHVSASERRRKFVSLTGGIVGRLFTGADQSTSGRVSSVVSRSLEYKTGFLGEIKPFKVKGSFSTEPVECKKEKRRHRIFLTPWDTNFLDILGFELKTDFVET